jgi:ATP:ADP antiporter, AAA family
MAAAPGTVDGLSGGFLGGLVAVKRHEVAALLASFMMFFTLLCAYYIIRPVRDEMGAQISKDGLQNLYSVVFVVMLCAVPLFGWIASRFSRRLVLPAIYVFFALNLLGFWIVLGRDAANPATAKAFFVWASVFNLFVISLFWSLMAELWSDDEAKRLFGFISAGGTAGGLAGPLVTQILVSYVAPANLLLVAALLLLASLAASIVVRRLRPGQSGAELAPAGGGIFDGALKVLQSPYLARIAVFVFLANVVGTFFYNEQLRLAATAFANSAERIKFFSSRDLIVGLIAMPIQVFGTAQVMKRLGVTAALIALPLVAITGTVALFFNPALTIVAAVMVAERVAAFSLSSPAIKVMYSLTSADEKYKVQNFIDTVVYRGGDAASGWLFSAVSGGAGFAATATIATALPLAALWLWTARDLGQAHAERAQEKSSELAA